MGREENAKRLLLNYFDNMREKVVFYRFVPGGIIFLTVHYGMIHDITGILAQVTYDAYLASYNAIPLNYGDDDAALAIIRRLSKALYLDEQAITFSFINPDDPSKFDPRPR